MYAASSDKIGQNLTGVLDNIIMITCVFENNSKAHLRHVVINVIIKRKNKILLGKRGTYNGKPIVEFGKWGLIGGYLDRDETFIECVKREVREETGWEIKNFHLFFINDTPDRPMEDKQNVYLVYLADAVKQNPEFKSNEEFTLGVLPKVTPLLILPLNPSLLFLFKTILIIPLIPSGLYFADGLVINSICLMEADGICCNT